MRIGIITTAFDEYRGGGEVFINLFNELRGQHEFVVFTGRNLSSPGSWRVETVKARSFSSYYGLNDYFFSRAAVRRLRNVQKKEKFDLLVINQVCGSPLSGLKDLGIPVIYLIHHPVSADVEIVKEETGFFERCRWMLRYGPMKKAQRRLVRIFPVLTVSESSREKIASDYKISKDRIHVIYNGVDTDFFHKTKPTKPRTILALGSYQHPRRGFVYLEEAYRHLTKEGFEIVDVGRRTDEQSEILKQIPRIQQLGVVSREKLPDIFSEASVTISTSLYEGFGLTVANSLACETPVVAFGAGGVVDILNLVDPSFLCEPRNVKQLVSKVRAIASAPAAGVRYREAICANFSRRHMAEQYQRLFQEIVIAS